MFIIIKQNIHFPSENDEVLNIFYTSDLIHVRDWIKEYINQDIISYSYSPIEQDLKYLTYELNDGEHNFQLLKKYKRVNRGYIYNSSERIIDVLYSISILEFDSEKQTSPLKTSDMYKSVNIEINNRILKSLDKDNILCIFNTIQDKIYKKNNWNKSEFVSVVSDTLREYKGALYKSISKRVKRFNKRQNLYKQKTVDHITINIDNIEQDNDTTFNNGNKQQAVSSCKLEAIKHEYNN